MFLNESLNEGNAKVTKVTKRSYKTGMIRVIEAGSSFSIVIHSDGWEQVLKAIHKGTGKFEDETGNTWVVQAAEDGDDVLFRGINGNRKSLRVDSKHIKKLH